MSNTDSQAPFPNMVPFTSNQRLPPKPTPADIDRTFDDLLTGLDFVSKRDTFKDFTTAQKKGFIENQEAHEKKVPSPEWIIDELAKNLDVHYIQSIGLSLKTARLEWVDRFCVSGGHILLLRELCGETAYHQTFDNSFRRDPSARNEILKALRFLVDSRHGSHHLLYFTPGIEIIVQAINRLDPEEFELVLHILLPFLFMDHGPMFLYSAFQRLAKLNNHRNPFRIFADSFASKKITKKGMFFVFLNGFYAAVARDYKMRQKLDFELTECGVCKNLTEMPDEEKEVFNEKCQSFLKAISTDFAEISALFGEPVACANIDDLFTVLKDAPKFGSLLVNLFSIAKNQPDKLKHLIQFLASFLVHYRKTLVTETATFEQATLRAYEYAVTGGDSDELVVPPASNLSSNMCYQNLSKDFAFTSDEDLKHIELDEKPSPTQTEIAELKSTITSLQESLEQERRKVEEQTKESEEVQRLKQELEEVRAENERLHASQQAIAELVQFIPTDMKPLFLQQLDIGTVLPAKPVDYGAAYKLLADLRARINEVLAKIAAEGKVTPELQEELETLLKAFEAQLNAMKQERDTIELNTNSMLKTIREERAAANTEFNQIRELQAKIINSLKIAELPQADEEEFTGELQVIANNPPSAPTRQFLWERLPDTCQKSKYWQSVISQRPEVKEEEVIELFGIKEIGEGRLLSAHTNAAYEHVLEKLKRPMEEIAKAVREESFSLAEKELLMILHLPISQVEYDNLINFNSDMSPLTQGEKFAVLLHRIPDFRGKVAGVIEHHKFDLEFQVTMQNLNKFSAALEQIKKSKNLNKIIAAVLAIGNTLNGGTARGGASGFALNDLRELRFMKANEKKVKLLNYIATVITREGIDLRDLRAELDRLQTASRLPLSTIMESLKTAQTQLAARPRVPFVVASSRRVLDAMKKVSLVQIEYDKLARAYGVREDLMKHSALIHIILDFSSDLSRALKENAIKVGKPAEPVRPPKPAAQPVVVDEQKSRGLIESMVNTLTAADASVRYNTTEGEELTEYQKAFAKVRKIVQ